MEVDFPNLKSNIKFLFPNFLYKKFITKYNGILYN